MTTTMPSTGQESPKFSGVIIHRDPRGRFSIRHASDWHVFTIRSDEPLATSTGAGEAAAPEAVAAAPPRKRRSRKKAEQPIAAREGIGFAPDPSDPATVFTVWASPLADGVVAEDLEDLKAGIDAGLGSLAGCQVEQSSDTVLGNLIRFERIYSFRERPEPDGPEVVRRRKQWLLYVDRWLICLTWQGSSPEQYDRYFAMANYSFLTFELPEALWFFTDRELLAQTSNERRATSSA